MTIALVDIGNRALQLLGTRTSMSSGEFSGQTSNEAIQLNISITAIQNWCFGLTNWNFARYTAILTSNKGPPPNSLGTWAAAYASPPWLYEFLLPSDFIRAWYVTNSIGGLSNGVNPNWLGEPQRFAMALDTIGGVQQEVMLTNQGAAILIYTAFVSNPTAWPWYFERLVVIALAHANCMAITGSLKLLEELSQQLEQQISISMQVNLSEGLFIEDTTPEWIQTLGINYPYRRLDGKMQQPTSAAGLQVPPRKPTPRQQ